MGDLGLSRQIAHLQIDPRPIREANPTRGATPFSAAWRCGQVGDVNNVNRERFSDGTLEDSDLWFYNVLYGLIYLNIIWSGLVLMRICTKLV